MFVERGVITSFLRSTTLSLERGWAISFRGKITS